MMLGVTEELFVLYRSHPDTYNLIGHVLFSLGRTLSHSLKMFLHLNKKNKTTTATTKANLVLVFNIASTELVLPQLKTF